ncbi:cytochrome c biogenesis CcdA family protein [Pseudahrensia aquimaris]|uniref:Cytochrome c biogenesis CcdA family protein n=1 Tax=Pseudahrensia aquimaris TaxID=744461 RepID=A0ABW3FLQ4_9HYPH
MGADITLFTIFFAGTLSFISPCVLPLVPPYLTYLAGVSIEELTGSKKSAAVTARVMTNAFAFVMGFTVVFVALGAGASTIGAMVRQYQEGLAMVAGGIIILMGLHFLGLLRIDLLYRELRFQTGNAGGIGTATLGADQPSRSRRASLGGSFLMGLAFAFGWTPCIGPVLGAVLSVAGSRESVGEGAGMLAIYSLGLGVPFMLSALFAETFMGFLQRFKRHLGTVEKIMGGLLVLTGIMFLTGWMQDAAFFLLETFPALQEFG